MSRKAADCHFRLLQSLCSGTATPSTPLHNLNSSNPLDSSVCQKKNYQGFLCWELARHWLTYVVCCGLDQWEASLTPLSPPPLCAQGAFKMEWLGLPLLSGTALISSHLCDRADYNVTEHANHSCPPPATPHTPTIHNTSLTNGLDKCGFAGPEQGVTHFLDHRHQHPDVWRKIRIIMYYPTLPKIIKLLCSTVIFTPGGLLLLFSFHL